MNGVISSGHDERPVLGLSAFFEALVWLAWRGGGGATRERAAATKAAKELAPSLRRLLADALLPRARAESRVAPLHQLMGDPEGGAVLP